MDFISIILRVFTECTSWLVASQLTKFEANILPCATHSSLTCFSSSVECVEFYLISALFSFILFHFKNSYLISNFYLR